MVRFGGGYDGNAIRLTVFTLSYMRNAIYFLCLCKESNKESTAYFDAVAAFC